MIFKGKVVAITGAAGGIGQSLCRLFLDEGAKIAAIDKKAGVEGLAAELKADTNFFASAVADVSDAGEVDRAFASLTGTLGAIEILVNNAGGSDHSTFARTDPAAWRSEIERNLNSAYYCAHAVLAPALEGFSPTPEMSQIAEAQALLEQLTFNGRIAS